jgi:hypothetical protein
VTASHSIPANRYGLTILPTELRLDAFGNVMPDEPLFAINEVPVKDGVTDDATHAALGKGLNKALYNYMHGVGLEPGKDLREWFEEIQVPRPTVSPTRSRSYLDL